MGTGHRRRSRRQRAAADRPECDRGRVGPQRAAAPAGRRAAGTAVLLRPSRVHRDVPLGPRSRPRPRIGDRVRSSRAEIARRGRRGRPRGERDVRALRGPDGARAGQRDQRARPGRHRAGRRDVERRPTLRACSRAVGRVRLLRSVDTRLVPPMHGDSSGVRGAAWRGLRELSTALGPRPAAWRPACSRFLRRQASLLPGRSGRSGAGVPPAHCSGAQWGRRPACRLQWGAVWQASLLLIAVDAGGGAGASRLPIAVGRRWGRRPACRSQWARGSVLPADRSGRGGAGVPPAGHALAS